MVIGMNNGLVISSIKIISVIEASESIQSDVYVNLHVKILIFSQLILIACLNPRVAFQGFRLVKFRVNLDLVKNSSLKLTKTRNFKHKSNPIILSSQPKHI